MTSFHPDPSSQHPGYIFKTNPDFQIDRLTSATQATSKSSDVTLLSSDGINVQTSKLLLSLHSPFLTHLLSSVPTHNFMESSVILPDCSSASLNNLISLLSSGLGASRHVGSDYRPASDVIDTAKLLGIRFGSLDYEVARESQNIESIVEKGHNYESSVEKSPNIESNMEESKNSESNVVKSHNSEANVEKSKNIKSFNVKNTDLEAKDDDSVKVWKDSQRKINKSQKCVQNELNNNALDQQSLQKKTDQSYAVSKDDKKSHDTGQNCKSFDVELKKDAKKCTFNDSKYPLSGALCKNLQTGMEKDSQKSTNQLSNSQSGSSLGNDSAIKKSELERPAIIEPSDTSEEKFKYHCEKCGKTCKSKYGLQKHMEWHLNKISTIVIYTCNTCGKQFKTKKGWKQHERAHLVENIRNSDEKESHVRHESERIEENASTPKLKIEKNQSSKARKSATLESRSSKTTLKQSKVCVEDQDTSNEKYDKINKKMVSKNGENNITKDKMHKKSEATAMENRSMNKTCSTKTKNSRSVSKKTPSPNNCSDNYGVKTKETERSGLNKRPILSTKDPAESAEGIFKKFENENFLQNLTSRTSKSTRINYFEGDNSSNENTSENKNGRQNLVTRTSNSSRINYFEGDYSSDENTSKSKIKKKKATGREKSSKCENANELVMPSSTPDRSRKSRGKKLKTDEDHLDYEWDGDKISSEDEISGPMSSPIESHETLNKPITADNRSSSYLVDNSQSTSVSERENFFSSNNRFSDIDTPHFPEHNMFFDE